MRSTRPRSPIPRAASSASDICARAASGSSRRPATAGQPRALVEGVRDPGRAKPPVEAERVVEVTLRVVPPLHDRRQRTEHPICGAVARDRVPDHRVLTLEGEQLLVDRRGERGVLDQGARVGRVGRARRRRVRPGGWPRGRRRRARWSSRRAASTSPISARSTASAGRQTLSAAVSPDAMRRTTGAISPSRPCSRRMLNIWIPYTAEELAVEPAGPARRRACAAASAASSRPSQSARSASCCSTTTREKVLPGALGRARGARRRPRGPRRWRRPRPATPCACPLATSDRGSCGSVRASSPASVRSARISSSDREPRVHAAWDSATMRAPGSPTTRAIATACDQHSPAAAWSPR